MLQDKLTANASDVAAKGKIPGKVATKGRILLFSYAFPPMQVQMTAAVYKPMAAIARSGFAVDVVCADSFCRELPLDHSLTSFAEKTFGVITRLRPSASLMSRLRMSSRVFSRVPDLMTVLHESAYETLMDLDLSQYDAVMTWSPFHSINSVMARVKKARPNVRWIAQFSDPWAGNPLEVRRLNKLWNLRHEPETVKVADFIVHSSQYSLELMLQHNPQRQRATTDVIPHAYDEALYPRRRKTKNAKITLRYVGVLYGRRSPEPLFLALAQLLRKRAELRSELAIQLVGQVPIEMLSSAAARELPAGMITNIPGVSYVESLEKMFDADILLLIEADIRNNLFLPSKLSDYLGANTPIVGIVPPGASEDAMNSLGCWHARPSDISGIALAIERAVDHVLAAKGSAWCDEEVRHEFSGESVARRFAGIVECLK